MAMQTRAPENLQERAFNLLDPENPPRRRQAYKLFYYQAKEIARDMKPADGLRLVDVVMSERDEEMRRLGMSAIISLLFHRESLADDPRLNRAMPSAVTSLDEAVPMLLCDFLWKESDKPSALISAVDPDHFVRDELAVIQFALRLGRNRHQQTSILPVSTSDQRAHRYLVDPMYDVFYITGRPGLHGDKFRGEISLPERIVEGQRWLPTRFGFTVNERPSSLPRIKSGGEQGAIDPAFNFLEEQLGDGTRRRYVTREFNGQREDWGLVQRYVVEISSKKRVVFICAGGSSLGTLGAVMWACQAIFPEFAASAEDAIPMCEKWKHESRVEALIRTTADTGSHVWESPKIELVALYAGKQMWEDKKWILRPPDEITLVGPRNDPTDILLDRMVRGLTSGKGMFALIAILAKSKLAGEAEIPFEALLSNKELFGQGGGDLDALTTSLNNLRIRYLSTALRVSGSGVSLQCKVRQIDSL
jgi:hypothetical protein